MANRINGRSPDAPPLQPQDVLTEASAVIWAAASLLADPVVEIGGAQEFALDLVSRLLNHLGSGHHLATCVTTRSNRRSLLHVGLPVSQIGADGDAVVLDSTAQQAFGSLLMLGSLTSDPVGILLRSCTDERHRAPGHRSTVQGWLVVDDYARPLNREAVQAVIRGTNSAVPQLLTAIPRHPETGVEYREAFSLYLP